MSMEHEFTLPSTTLETEVVTPDKLKSSPTYRMACKNIINNLIAVFDTKDALEPYSEQERMRMREGMAEAAINSLSQAF